MGDLISLKDAAIRLGVGPHQAYKMHRAGKFPSARRLSARYIVIDSDDLLRPDVAIRPKGYPKGRPRHQSQEG